MKKKAKIIISLTCYAAVICAGILLIPRFFHRAPAQENKREVVYGSIELPAPLYPSAPGSSVAENRYASIDYSNSSQGYISVRYTGGAQDDPVLKVICGETEYLYILGDVAIIPLTCGDGTYTVKAFQKQKEGKYRSVISKTLSVELENQLLPYLYPSQLVSYADSSLAVQHSKEMCAGIDSDLEKLKSVYNYITENIAYDYQKAANIETGYIPSVDSIYISKSGICFDYSVMMAAMLRTQLIPVKLVMGYLNGTSIYHAWNEVYLRDKGWVTVNLFVDEKVFRTLDATVAASKGDNFVAQRLSDPDEYLPSYKY